MNLTVWSVEMTDIIGPQKRLSEAGKSRSALDRHPHRPPACRIDAVRRAGTGWRDAALVLRILGLVLETNWGSP
jgi:hypothetical protein